MVERKDPSLAALIAYGSPFPVLTALAFTFEGTAVGHIAGVALAVLTLGCIISIFANPSTPSGAPWENYPTAGPGSSPKIWSRKD